ncbi:ABC1 kinase family protein [Lederbergia citrea]|uniref:AarF/ABC1/UbiB kinase family protein n=1 Tax=Lederbergia citrea TaxID=2833581 RepID=A0A942Z647_9BACI|nr:AarF/UbiB family protein [Lederbergia citrea]MBS4224115.1 AarF/ABC1/UbiB kinase family protein [Lederbergia citrea]
MKANRKWMRMCKVLSFAIAVVIQVYWYRFRKKTDSDWDKLWVKIGQKFRQMLFDLEGLLIKVGQMLSIRADILPSSFIQQIQDLVDHVPPSPWADIKLVLEKEWGRPIEDMLLSIEPKSVASASIGEIYQGRLKDGTKVAIKVQRPIIKSIIKTDFRSLAIIVWFVRHFVPLPKGFISFKLLFDELKYVIERELDFKKEMNSINHFRQRFSSFSKLTIPEVFPELCTSRVLVMEWVDGKRITDVDFLNQCQIDRNELSQRLFRVFIPQWLEAGVFHADPHAGNVLVQANGTIALLDFGMVGEISKKDAMNFQELFQAIIMKNYSKAVGILIDLGFLLPSVNPKIIEGLLKEALSFDVGQLKNMDLFAVKKEMNDIVKSLPIHVPTRFIFLGRSVVTIEGMIRTINPDKEILEIAKPVFMDWFKESNLNKWTLVLNWIDAQPFFQIFRSIADLLSFPQQLLKQKETLQQREFIFSMYENQKKRAFYIGAIGLIALFPSLYLQHSLTSIISAGLAGVSFVLYFISAWRQKSWLSFIDYNKDSRR